MIQNLLQMKYQDHHVHVSRDTSNNRWILFKYNDQVCDFAVYSQDDGDAAAEYVLEPLPKGSWEFVEDPK